MTTGELIRAARKKAGLTQKELGAKLGVSGAMIAQYETGVRTPKIETLQKISNALNLDIVFDFLFDVKYDKEVQGVVLSPSVNPDGMDWNALAQKSTSTAYREILLEYFDKLNDIGQEKAVSSLREISTQSIYTDPITPKSSDFADFLKKVSPKFSEFIDGQYNSEEE